MHAFRPLIAVLGAAALAVSLNIVKVDPAASAITLGSYPDGVVGGTFDADGRLSNPALADGVCDVVRPAYQYVTFPSYAQTARQICGIWSMENLAAATYNAKHGYEDGHASLPSDLYVQAGYLETMLQSIAYKLAHPAESEDPLTADELAAYDWFLAVQQKFEQTAAAAAMAEYREWEDALCNYRPPNTELFTYRPTDQHICNPDGSTGLSTLYTSLTPPTYAQFVTYGRYLAEQNLGLTNTAKDAANQVLIDNGIVAGAGALVTAFSTQLPALLSGIGGSALNSVLTAAIKAIAPHNEAYFQAIEAAEMAVSRAAQATTQIANLAELGSSAPAELTQAATTIVEGVAEQAGVAESALTEAASAGATSITGPLIIASVAVTILVMQAINVFTAVAIPGELDKDIAKADPANTDDYVWKLITANGGAGGTTVYANFKAQLDFPDPTIGVSDDDCTVSVGAGCTTYDEVPVSAANAPTRIRVTPLNADYSPTGWSSVTDTATFIDTWGLGSTVGALGVPHVSLSVAGGRFWTKRSSTSAPTDESEAGLSGWLPSGDLRYFNAAGQPMIASLSGDGDSFVTQVSAGSVDAGGYDAGECGVDGECGESKSIIVMAGGGTPQLRDEMTAITFAGIPCNANTTGAHDCFSETLKADGRIVPAWGSLIYASDGEKIEQKGTSRLYKLTLLPDTGTPASVWATNSYNTWANNTPDGVAPNGGLVAGDTVTFTDPETSPAGYDTTYTWHVQTVCPADPATPAKTVQGVMVCSDNPRYGSTSLAANEQDLTSCVADFGTCSPGTTLGVTWTADPAFHGGPVATLTGQSVDFTWKAPGTYHVRLIATDEYGVTKRTDRNYVVSAASKPRSALAYASAADPQPVSVAPQVIGPVSNGNALTLSGCVDSPTTIGGKAYATPAVSVAWGDGTTSAADDVALTHGSDDCTTPWSWTTTHTYALSLGGQPFGQVPITVTTEDVTTPATAAADLPVSTSTVSSLTLYANVYAATQPPTFAAGDSTTYDFAAGESRTVKGYLSSVPTATITQSDATGVSLGGSSCTPGLPTGVGFQASNDNHFEITGTPRVDAGGCYALDVAAQNTYGTTHETVIVAVAQTPAITSASSAGWETGHSGSLTVTATGFPKPALTAVGSLPADVTFTDNHDGTATLSGTGLSDSDTGIHPVTIKATSTSGTDTQPFTLTIEGKPVFTTPSSTGFFTGRSATFRIGVSSTTPVTVTCHLTGSDDHCRTGDGSRPYIDPDVSTGTGLSLSTADGTPIITGIPAAAGSYPVTLTAANTAGTTTQTLTILVSASGGATISMVAGGNLTGYTAPTGTVPASGTAPFTIGSAGAVTLCSNAPGDTLTTETVVDDQSVATDLPTGLTITPVTRTSCALGYDEFTLSGTPSGPANGATGTTAYRIVDSAGGLALLTLRLLASGAPVFSTPDTATFTVGEAGSFTAAAGTMRYDSAYLYAALSKTGELPAGLAFTANAAGTATISGTPTVSGRRTVTLTATNGSATNQTLTIDVRRAPEVTSAATAGLRVGAGGTVEITTNADAYPVPALSVAGLPAGITFTDDGDGTGTLRVARSVGTTDVSVDVSATSVAGTDTTPLHLVVGVEPDIVTDTAALVFERNVASDAFEIEATGWPVPTLTADHLAPGLTLTDHGDGTATLAGTPTTAGASQTTVTAGNAMGSAALSIDVLVTDAAAFTDATTTRTFVALADQTWTLHSSGSPTPAIALTAVTCDGEEVGLPEGLTFAHDDDAGTATISGAAEIGTGAACPAGYDVALTAANAGSTDTVHLTLSVQEVIELATPSTTDPFVAGAPGVATIGASGSPSPSISLHDGSALPSWLALTDQGDGTALLSGTAPMDAAGTSVTFSVDLANDTADTVVEEITVPVSTITLTSATPPSATLGEAYSFQFEGTPGTSYALAEHSALPDGLTLSPSGKLSGTPTGVGRYTMALTLAKGGETATTGAMSIVVGVGEDALEITQFRTYPTDWFVQVTNTTDAPIPLDGWKIGLQQPSSTAPESVPLSARPRILQPGATAVVATSSFTLAPQLDVDGYGAPVVPLASGFEVIAPNGAVIDKAGVVGALPGVIAGTGATYPARFVAAHRGYAFVRNGFATGAPVNTDDNADDFTFAPIVGASIVPDPPTTPTTPATPGAPGAPGTPTAAAGDSSATVSWSAAADNGSAITGYTVTASPGGATATTTGLSVTVAGLTNGTAYTFSVVAANEVGAGPASGTSDAVTPSGRPGAPGTPTAVASNAIATVFWSAASANGSPVTGYTVTASPGGASVTTTGLSAVVTGLTNGTAYTFTVVATNANGTGAQSQPSAAVTPTARIVDFPARAKVCKPTGTLKVGQRLSSCTRRWPTGTSFTYQWQANGEAIKGATGRTLELSKKLRGKHIRVAVTASKTGYESITKVSPSTARVKKR